MTSNGDENVPQTLRGAVFRAPPGGTILFDASVTGTITLENGDLVINKNLTIAGPGAGMLRLGSPTGRILTVESGTVRVSGLGFEPICFGSSAISNGGVLTLEGVVVDGPSGFCSGAIENQGTLTIAASVIQDLGAPPVVNNGILEIRDTTLRDNAQPLQNGGQSALITGCTISGTAFGGGLRNFASLEVTNTTISGNAGVGLRNDSGTATLTNCTITANVITSGIGAGIDNAGPGTVQLRNTVLADHARGNCSGVISSLGHNLDDDTTCALGAAGDLSDVGAGLGPLADNGGPTSTHALLEGSPAIDAADPAFCPATDQRGFPRQATCDIGAYEFQPGAESTPSPTSTSTPEPTPPPTF